MDCALLVDEKGRQIIGLKRRCRRLALLDGTYGGAFADLPDSQGVVPCVSPYPS